MKKAINKTEREEILLAVVTHSAQASAQRIVDDLTQVRLKIRNTLLNNWEDNYPGISGPDRVSLLQSRGAVSLGFKPSIYAPGSTKADGLLSPGEFGKLSWSNSGSDVEKQRMAAIASRIMQLCAGAPGVVSERVTSGWTSAIQISSTYPDLIAGHQPHQLFAEGAKVPNDVDAVLNDTFMRYHVEVTKLLKELKDLFFSAEKAYHSLASAIAPVKTAQQLAELMPEAIKHFPPSLTYVKPTKEIADPKAINEIRAKLKKGLPI